MKSLKEFFKKHPKIRIVFIYYFVMSILGIIILLGFTLSVSHHSSSHSSSSSSSSSFKKQMEKGAKETGTSVKKYTDTYTYIKKHGTK